MVKAKGDESSFTGSYEMDAQPINKKVTAIAPIDLKYVRINLAPLHSAKGSLDIHEQSMILKRSPHFFAQQANSN